MRKKQYLCPNFSNSFKKEVYMQKIQMVLVMSMALLMWACTDKNPAEDPTTTDTPTTDVTPAVVDTEDGNTEKPQRLANALAVEVILYSVAEDDQLSVAEELSGSAIVGGFDVFYPLRRTEDGIQSCTDGVAFCDVGIG